MSTGCAAGAADNESAGESAGTKTSRPAPATAGSDADVSAGDAGSPGAWASLRRRRSSAGRTASVTSRPRPPTAAKPHGGDQVSMTRPATGEPVATPTVSAELCQPIASPRADPG